MTEVKKYRLFNNEIHQITRKKFIGSMIHAKPLTLHPMNFFRVTIPQNLVFPERFFCNGNRLDTDGTRTKHGLNTDKYGNGDIP